MKKIKLLLMMFLTAAVCAGFQSCSDDEEEDGATFSDFYIECSNVSGGGLNSQDCANLRADLNEDLINLVIPGQTKSEAIDFFDEFMEGMGRALSSLQPDEPLKVIYELRTQGNGKCVKRTTLTITKGGVSLS